MTRQGRQPRSRRHQSHSLAGQEDAAVPGAVAHQSSRSRSHLNDPGELQGNRVELQTDLARDLPEVPGDRVQLQQIILNLILNAVEAMSGVADRTRELVVGSGASDSDVFVEVRDSGSGLDAASLDRMFDSFYTTKPNGMGMGLSISRSIVEAHGGRLVATQNAPQVLSFASPLPTGGREMPASSSSAVEQRSADASG